MASDTPNQITLRWGIIGTGLIASWFVSDLVRDPTTHRNEHDIKHVVQAIGSSSIQKVQAFASKYVNSNGASAPPSALYASYQEVFDDPHVDVVYIATPHALHMRNTIDAINSGKHVLCEKPMAINAKEARYMVDAARKKGVFLMEAVWTRFFPVARELQRLIHIEGVIGKPTRALIDFGLDMPLDKQPPESRTADLKLGAGSLLDIGIYSLTWAGIVFHPDSVSSDKWQSDEMPAVASSLTLNKGVDEMSSVVLSYPRAKAQAICTASYLYKSESDFGRIEGTEGAIIVYGKAASKPSGLKVRRKGKEEQLLEFPVDGWGFFYEADAVARDIRDGRTENQVMPLDETLRMMSLMDEVRRQNGLAYPQDEE